MQLDTRDHCGAPRRSVAAPVYGLYSDDGPQE